MRIRFKFLERKHYGGLLENTLINTHEVVERLVLEEKNHDTILDIPSGEGAFAKRMVEKHGMKVHAADCDHIIKFDGAEFKVADMNNNLPYDDGMFDGVCCIDGIEHIERPFDFIKECARIIKKDGFFIIVTPNISSLRSRWRWLLTGFHHGCKWPLDETDPMPLHHINMVSFPELRYRLATNGFVIKSIATNQIKLISWIYIFLIPFSLIATYLVFRKNSPTPSRARINKEVFRQMFSIPTLFGAGLIVKSKKV
ncbi:MAG: class I SAM-dependent methyltransferase [Thermodesulfobacteriota bacterium]